MPAPSSCIVPSPLPSTIKHEPDAVPETSLIHACYVKHARCTKGTLRCRAHALQIVDAKKASYGVDNALFAVTQLAQTTMRSDIGKISLDKTFEERDTLNRNIVEAIRCAACGRESSRREPLVVGLSAAQLSFGHSLPNQLSA